MFELVPSETSFHRDYSYKTLLDNLNTEELARLKYGREGGLLEIQQFTTQ
jgi:hypothetical protein